jgi:hypothetical protein
VYVPRLDERLEARPRHAEGGDILELGQARIEPTTPRGDLQRHGPGRRERGHDDVILVVILVILVIIVVVFVVGAVDAVVVNEVSIGGGGGERVSGWRSAAVYAVDAVYAGRRAHQIFDFT